MRHLVLTLNTYEAQSWNSKPASPHFRTKAMHEAVCSVYDPELHTSAYLNPKSAEMIITYTSITLTLFTLNVNTCMP